MEIKAYYEKDTDLSLLAGKKVAIIGFGSQGHAQSLNLRDSGVQVVVAELPGTANYKLAEQYGFKPVSAPAAAEQGDIIQILAPDHSQAKIYASDVKPNLKPGKTLMFSHGFSIHYRQIVPPEGVDVVMVAPKGPGHTVRSEYEKGAGVPCLVAVEQDATGKALQTALAYANGIGAARAGIIPTTFKEETESDLFGEQAVLCGGVTALIQAAFDTLTEAGYKPEIAYFECLHELKLIVDLFYQGGFDYMRYSVSDTAEYGDYTRGPRVVTDETRKEMKRILTEIQSGQFAKEWILENMCGQPSFNALRRLASEHPINEVGEKLREMMPWIKKPQK